MLTYFPKAVHTNNIYQTLYDGTGSETITPMRPLTRSPTWLVTLAHVGSSHIHILKHEAHYLGKVYCLERPCDLKIQK